MTELFQISSNLINRVNLDLKRFLYHQIDWDGRLVEINGARGTGKTTLLLQKANELNSADADSVLYISLEDPYFYKNNLVELAEEFRKLGGLYLFLDEVHRYPSKNQGSDWSAELKIIYDRYPGLKVYYSGSSLLRIYKGKGDLSRRKITYNLPGLSFREYLYFTGVLKFRALSLEEILNNHVKLTTEILSISGVIMPHFRNYIKTGYFPFYFESPDHYFARLKDVTTVILENDIPSVTEIPFETVIKLKKLLGLIATGVPFTPNLSNLRKELFIADQRTLLRYFGLLEKAELIYNLRKESRGNQLLRKPDKILPDNTNLAFSFDTNPDIGTLREIFFVRTLRVNHMLTTPPKGDFLVDGVYAFEVGGKIKTMKQLQNIENAFLALDDIETGYGPTIPLWLFGFLF
jgi:hypothetical protein